MTVFAPANPLASLVIAEAVASGSSNTLTFDNIPQSFRHLRVVMNARTSMTGGAGVEHAFMRFNNDSTAANYAFQEMRGILGTVADGVEITASGGCLISVGPPDDGPASTMGWGETTIFDYRGGFHKPVIGGFGTRFTGGIGVVVATNIWLSTAAITRIDLVAEQGNWMSGIKATLIGIF